MPDIINLLSSSPEPEPVKTKKKAGLPVSKQPLTSKSLQSSAPKRKNEDYFTLSSDSIDAETYLPPPKPASKPSITPHTSTNPEGSVTTISKAANTSKEFFFLSEDFDSTVNLEDSVALELPPAKKRRLSPPSGSRITQSRGYQNWLDTLEKSTASSSPKDNPISLPSQKRLVAATGASSRLDAPKPVAESSRSASLSGPSFKPSPSTTAFRVASGKRSISDIGAASKPAQPRSGGAGLMRSKTMSAAVEPDPIVFTSSPDPRADAKKRKDAEAKKRKRRIDAILEDSSDSDVFKLNTPKKGKKKADQIGSMASDDDNGFESSDADLPEIGAIPSYTGRSETSRDKTKASSKSSKSKSTLKKAPLTALEKYEAERAKEKTKQEKEQLAKDKVVAKEAEKVAKKLAREEKAREKDRAAELAKVNVLRTDKKKSTPEMIVDLPSCLDLKLSGQVQRYLTAVEANHSQYDSTQPIVKWRRKIDAEFDEEAGHWEKVEPYIGHEAHIMYIVTAKEFVDLATAEEGRDLNSHVLRLKAKFSTNKIIYLIEGLDPWMKKNKNVRNRKFIQDVRNQMPAEEPTASQKRKRKPEPEYVDEDMVEDALLKLQVIHGVLIHHTRVMIETAEWIIVFTQHISTIPYRAPEQDLGTGFCMDAGQVKTGDDPADTFAKMLQEMSRVTAPVAYGIAAEYPTVQKLVNGLRTNGPFALQDCRKMANKNGAFTDKRIGPSISKRLHNIFTSRHAGSWDV